jgi:excisionase family DNA binding protein
VPDTPVRYFTRAEAAAQLRVSLSTIARWLRAGVIPACRFGGTIRIPVSALMGTANAITTPAVSSSEGSGTTKEGSQP